MTTAVQHRRGTTAEHSTFTGLEGEVTIDTTKDTAVIHDGSLAGGYPLAKETLANVNPSTLSAITGAATASDDLFLMYDTSALSMKKISRAELNNAITIEALDTVDINGGTIDGTAIGGTTPAAGAFTTLSASGSVTLSGGTANGVAYLNGSKVLTSGSALTFDGTEVFKNSGGTIQYNDVRGSAAAGTRLSAGGTLGTDSFDLFQNSSYGAVWNRANTPIAFAVNGSEQMRLTSTGLGIGTSSPASKLHLSGAATVDARITLTQTTAGLTSTLQQGSSGLSLSAAGSQSLLLETNGVTRATIDSSGNLGLGVTPSAWSALTAMQIGQSAGFVGHSSANFNYILSNAYYNGVWRYKVDGSALRYTLANNSYTWDIAGSGTAGNAISFTQAMTLDASGNLGIGTTSPGAKLTVAGGRIQVTGNTAPSSGTGLELFYDGTGAGTLAFARGTGYIPNFMDGSQLQFFTSSSERARIDSSGNLGLGVTPSAWGSAYRALDLYGAGLASSTTGGQTIFAQNAYNNGSNYIYKYTAAATLYHQLIGEHRFYTAPSGTAGNAISFTQAMTLDASGRLGLGVTSPTNKLVVYDSANTAMDVQDASRTLRLGVTSAGFGYVAQVTNHPLVFSTNNTERARITSDGYLRMASGTGGIQFNGDTAAANALDDYEEGTWTPVIDSGYGGNTPTANWTAASSTYVKIGKVVHVRCRLANTSTDSILVDDRFRITGLPFNVRASSGVISGGTCFVYDTINSGNNAMGAAALTSGDNNVWVYITHIDGSVNYTDYLSINVTYEVD